MKNYKYYDNLLFVDGIYMFRKNGQWQAYGVENKRNFITKKAVSIFFTLILGFAIVISLLLPALGKNVAFLIADFFRISNIIVFVWVYIRWVIVFFILFITIALLYHIVP